MKLRTEVGVVAVIAVVFFGCWGIYSGVQRELDERAQGAAYLAKWHEANKTTKAGILCEKHPDWHPTACEAVVARKVGVGMNAEQVKLAWGKPRSINRTRVSGLVTEQWVYDGSYVYLDNGIVTGTQTEGKP
jgi:hypothetical protein